MIKLAEKKGLFFWLMGLTVFILLYFLLSNNPYVRSVFNNLSGGKSQASLLPVIPRPVHVALNSGNFTITENTTIYIQGRNAKETEEISRTGLYFSDALKSATGFSMNMYTSESSQSGGIFLTTLGGDVKLGPEGYQLEITPEKIVLKSTTSEGIFRGIQTIRQMLPSNSESNSFQTDTSWTIPCSRITDYPAYPWRGMMLDTARHFYQVEEVKRVIDLIALYKMNKFHLHLTDDQGWRIEIKSWPLLTEVGGSSEVGGGGGGYYTQQEFSDIVEYAKARYITVIPEIDMPGHTNAVLASYDELNTDGKRKEPYTGTEVGFSSLMCREAITFKFVDDVINELAALTPGEYIHIGGDEASATSKEDYDYFIGRVNEIVKKYNKTAIGWSPFDTSSGTPSDAILQQWKPDSSTAQRKDMKIILSPPDKAYIDMKYYENSPLGLSWAGLSSTEDAYHWDPESYAPKENILGVECALWSETIKSMDDLEYLAFPRLPGHAEIGWTPRALRDWSTYRQRLKSHGPRMQNQEIDFFKDPVVPW